MSGRNGPPKHQNKFGWNPNAGHKKNEKELGGKFRPYSEITGVCPRCREQIEWKRRYGKYKPLVEPAKWDQIVGRDASEVEAERNALQQAIKNARERDRRTLLRAMNSGKAGCATKSVKIGDRSREGNLFPATSIGEYAELANENDCDEDGDEDLICK